LTMSSRIISKPGFLDRHIAEMCWELSRQKAEIQSQQITETHLGLTRQITETPRGEDKSKAVRDSWRTSRFPRIFVQKSWKSC
jgi:hypothetical protein